MVWYWYSPMSSPVLGKCGVSGKMASFWDLNGYLKAWYWIC
jgi:hypothetical protein